jgi:thiol-disulfide isomerase/thioredoxin
MKRSLVILLVVGVAAGATVALATIVQSRIGAGIDLSSLPSSSQPVNPSGTLPVLGTMPAIEGIAGWINTKPLVPADLKGKVVLVDFWTYSCINCLRTLPYVKSWDATYADKGLVVIGVHTPEFDFEKDPANVQAAVTREGIRYPVALDNDYKTWTNFGNQYWPAQYLFDKDGKLRYTHFGEGNETETEAAIQQLLGLSQPMVSPGSATAFEDIRSPETYFGYARGERFASPEPVVKDQEASYAFPGSLPPDGWALMGRWTIGAESAVLTSGAGRFAFHYDAGEANAVLDTADGKPHVAVVLLDGKPVPKAAKGADVTYDADGQSLVRVDAARLYELVNGPAGSHLLEIDFAGGPVKLFTMTFGANVHS